MTGHHYFDTECKIALQKSSNFILQIEVDFFLTLTLQTIAPTNPNGCAERTSHPSPTTSALTTTMAVKLIICVSVLLSSLFNIAEVLIELAEGRQMSAVYCYLLIGKNTLDILGFNMNFDHNDDN